MGCLHCTPARPTSYPTFQGPDCLRVGQNRMPWKYCVIPGSLRLRGPHPGWTHSETDTVLSAGLRPSGPHHRQAQSALPDHQSGGNLVDATSMRLAVENSCCSQAEITRQNRLHRPVGRSWVPLLVCSPPTQTRRVNKRLSF